MDRVQIVSDYVYSKLNSIYNDNLRLQALQHTNGVDTICALLALVRGQNVELAKIAGMFHDYSSFVDNVPHSQHSKVSALKAQTFMRRCGCFSSEEIDEVSFAIMQHSLKAQFDTPLAEILKDADIMAHFLQEPSRNYTGIKKQRLLDACAELSFRFSKNDQMFSKNG